MRHAVTYILDAAGEPVLEPDVIKWSLWFRRARVLVKKTTCGLELEVATIFLGIAVNRAGPPQLWETMVFAEGKHDGHELDHCAWRCAGTREQAEAQHAEVCALVWPQLAKEQPKEIQSDARPKPETSS